MSSPIDQLQSAGFSDDEIAKWSAEQRTTLSGAGFSNDEIDDYLGGPKKPVPPAFLQRVARAFVAPGQLAGQVGTGLWEGLGLPGEELKERLPKMSTPEQIGAMIGRIPGGLLVDPIRQAGETTEAALTGQPVSAEEMRNAAMLIAGGTGQSAVFRWQNEIMGEGLRRGDALAFPGIQPIGRIPERSMDFSDAAQATVGTPVPEPHVREALEKIWDDHGIHPAEVAHDAARDVTITQDLAGGKVPETYAPATTLPVPAPVPGGAPQIRSYTPGELRVDPERFQFKAGTDAAGVSQRLQGVTQWDPIKAGVGIVWEDEAGHPYIVDGHQRLGLANRIAESDPEQSPALNAWTLRAADGVTDTEARAIAAAKNIAEGTGTPVDAAKVLRDRPDLLPSLPPRSEVVRQAQGLMNLSDDAFGKVVNDVVPPNYGAIVGRLAADNPTMQSALIDLLHETGPENVTQAEAIVRQGLDAGLYETTQQTLFGPEQMASSLYGERARVLDRALKQLRRDRTVFQSIVDNSAIIEELGNQLARDENLRRAAVDGRAAQIIQTLANRKGPLSDALTNAARAIADGSATPAAAARDFVAEIRRQAESGDLTRLADGGDRGTVATAGADQRAGPERNARDVSAADEARANTATQEALRPATEATAQGEQLIIPGAERSAVQAAASREAEGRGKLSPQTEQQAPGGLFAPPALEQPSLFTQIMRSEEGSLRLQRPGPPRRPSQEAVLSRLSIGETDNGRPWSWSRIYSTIVDRLNPIRDVVRQSGEKLPTAEDPYQLARLFAGVSGQADHWLNHGTFDFENYRPNGKSLREILAPISDLDDFRSFATSLRAIELENRGIKTGIDLGAARQEATLGAQKYAPIMAELVVYQDHLAAYLRDAGVLSHEGYAAMRAANPLYLPFQRVFGDVMGDILPDVIRGQGASLQALNPIHEIVGSERRIIDPLESIVRNTYLSLAMAERNRVGTKLIDLIQRAGNLPVPARVDDVSIYRNGTRETYKVSADLAAAMKGLDEESVSTALRLLGVPARMLRAGATLTPDFMLRNVIRDFFSAVINTTKGVFTPFDTAKGLIASFNKDERFQDWMKSGGANAALVALDRRYLQTDIAKLTEDTGLGTRAWNVVRHPIDTLRAVSQLSEHATRVGEFIAARDKALAAGATPLEADRAAAMSSREVTIDFARRGSMTRAMNMITAFWNAQVQGVDRLARAFRDDPGGTSAKITFGITLPSVLLWVNNHNDPRYQEIPQWERDLFWIVMVGDHIFRIPKPFEVGVIFGSGAERLLDAFYDKRPEAFHDFAKSVSGALMPGAVPTVALPFVEQLANRSTFTDRPLIPAQLEKQLPEYQYNPYTTETAKAVGGMMGAFPGLRDASVGDGLGAGVARALSTPILLENYLRSWTGGLGTYALQAFDAGLRKNGLLPDPPKPSDTLADIPVVKAFVVRYPSASAESIQRFYDGYEANKRYFDTWVAKARDGDAAAMEHIAAAGGDKIFVQLDGIKEAMGEHAQLVRDIWKSPEIPPDEKRQLIDQLYYSEIQIAQAGVSMMRQVEKMLAPTPPTIH